MEIKLKELTITTILVTILIILLPFTLVTLGGLILKSKIKEFYF